MVMTSTAAVARESKRTAGWQVCDVFVDVLDIPFDFFNDLQGVVKWSETNISAQLKSIDTDTRISHNCNFHHTFASSRCTDLGPGGDLIGCALGTLNLCWLHCTGGRKIVLFLLGMGGEIFVEAALDFFACFHGKL